VIAADRTLAQRASLAPALVTVGLASGAFSSFNWLTEYAPNHGVPPTLYNPQGYDLYNVDCRKLAGARLGEKAERAYVDPSLYYLYVGCRPTYVPGGERAREVWGIKIYPDPSKAGFRAFDQDEPGLLRVVCPTSGTKGEVCQRVPHHTRCKQEGEAFTTCATTAADRAKMLSSL
jgi:hypothetical protein